MSWCAAALRTGCMRRCSAFTPTCLACVTAFRVTAEHIHHDRFVFYMHVLGVHVSFPPVHLEQGIKHTMCRVVHAWQTTAIHDWMGAGYCSLRDAHAAAGWPLAPWQWHLESLPLWHGVSVQLLPVFLPIHSVPRHVAFAIDGSWFPSHRCGGAFAVVCRETLIWTVYLVPIPCQLDHSYTTEVYTSWAILPTASESPLVYACERM